MMTRDCFIYRIVLFIPTAVRLLTTVCANLECIIDDHNINNFIVMIERHVWNDDQTSTITSEDYFDHIEVTSRLTGHFLLPQ